MSKHDFTYLKICNLIFAKCTVKAGEKKNINICGYLYFKDEFWTTKRSLQYRDLPYFPRFIIDPIHPKELY